MSSSESSRPRCVRIEIPQQQKGAGHIGDERDDDRVLAVLGRKQFGPCGLCRTPQLAPDGDLPGQVGGQLIVFLNLGSGNTRQNLFRQVAPLCAGAAVNAWEQIGPHETVPGPGFLNSRGCDRDVLVFLNCDRDQALQLLVLEQLLPLQVRDRFPGIEFLFVRRWITDVRALVVGSEGTAECKYWSQ